MSLKERIVSKQITKCGLMLDRRLRRRSSIRPRLDWYLAFVGKTGQNDTSMWSATHLCKPHKDTNTDDGHCLMFKCCWCRFHGYVHTMSSALALWLPVPITLGFLFLLAYCVPRFTHVKHKIWHQSKFINNNNSNLNNFHSLEVVDHGRETQL